MRGGKKERTREPERRTVSESERLRARAREWYREFGASNLGFDWLITTGVLYKVISQSCHAVAFLVLFSFLCQFECRT